MPRKGGSARGAPKKRWTTNYCKWCKADGGPFTTHNIVEWHKFDKDSKQKDMPAKPFDSLKKPWKTGGGDSGQVAYLTQEMERLKKKHTKTKFKKRSKKHADQDSSYSDSNSE